MLVVCSQGARRKTLHAPFGLAFKMVVLAERLYYNGNTRELQDYIDKVLTTKLHGFQRSVPRACPPTCSGAQGPVPCTVQDLWNFRCNDGESSIGGKAMFLCEECTSTFDSKSLVAARLEKMGLNDNGDESAVLL
jgi:hypothetical protein